MLYTNIQRIGWSFLILILVFSSSTLVSAGEPKQEVTPWELIEDLNAFLFEAQKEMLFKDPEGALAATDMATEQLAQIVAAFPDFPDSAVVAAEEAIALARDAIEAENSNQVSVAKGRLRTAMLLGSFQLTEQYVNDGSYDQARDWLLVRDFRPSTRFDRPGADATIAVTELSEGVIEPDVAWQRIEADLLDTYQGKMIETLGQAGSEELFFNRRSESAGLAVGYWQLLATSFEAQAGAEAVAELNSTLDQMTTAVILENEADIQNTIGTVEGRVQNFRAAQLSEAELVRRTGQLIRYVSLIPVEYERGVEDGEVFIPFEIQEAVTFMKGAQAAFSDLRPALYLDQPELVDEVQRQLDTVQTNLDNANRQVAVIPVADMKSDVRALTNNMDVLLPEEWNQLDPDADFDVIASVLDQVEAAVVAGQYDMAESAHLEAYAVFDFGPEPRLLAFAPEQVSRIDGIFWQGYNGEPGLAVALNEGASPEEVNAIRLNLDSALTEAQRTLGDLPSAPGAIITNAAIIVFREGLEAVVILAALTASFVGAMAHFRRYVGIGALIAFVATIITGAIMQQLLSSFARFGERLEAVVSLVAIGVILLITNWFFHKAYWTDHMKDMHQQKSGIMKQSETGQIFGLITLGFTSIYREGFETALFLQALFFEAGTAIVLQGVLFGLIGVAAAGVVTFVLQRRLPYMKMFVATAVLIGLVLFTMVGNTIHVMQKVGWMTLSPIRWLDIPYWMGLWFGLFPTWEGIGFQLGSAAFVIGSYYLAEYLRHREREARKLEMQRRKQQREAQKAQKAAVG
ncbi:MAG: FTR1 family protein [Chloroflexota bacterium]